MPTLTDEENLKMIRQHINTMPQEDQEFILANAIVLLEKCKDRRYAIALCLVGATLAMVMPP